MRPDSNVSTALTASVLIFLSYVSPASAHAENVCTELEAMIDTNKDLTGGPARHPTKEEQAIIEKAEIPLHQFNDYAIGTTIVDFDNDGKDDVVAWSIAGSGRFVTAAVYSFTEGPTRTLELKGQIDLGILQDPRFFRLHGINYVVASTDGDDTTNYAATFSDGLTTVCRMKTVVTPRSKCRHPACKALVELIIGNDDFVRLEWPHKYFSPAGAAIFFPRGPEPTDFDNSGSPTKIWRFGRKHYDYQYIYWTLLGLGDEMPEFDDALREGADSSRVKRVLPGEEHNRLRRTLDEQSIALSTALRRAVVLPTDGDFFLFQANGDRTYWAWDIGVLPHDGSTIHIMYTNAHKSDYIGTVEIERIARLMPCDSDCTQSLR